MASDQQLTLSRSHSHVSKHSRQIVPAFLQKLYEMVSDKKNESLIRWSDDGDSFFVLDHERFANQLLGRWFKHKNFSSFVRQLNMYGFHKIPHLQQGVLRSDAETEFWNFAHASFRRDQPDLLCLIQRKKQSSQQQIQIQQQADDVVAAAAAAGFVSDVNGNPLVGLGPTATALNGADGAAGPGLPNVAAGALGASGPGSTGLTVLSNAQILDIHSIVQGITAIKRHQATISAELSELKRSNQLLWQDALLTREKHQKQEDTINRIVKFLAGVFGKQDAPGSGGVGNGGHHGGGHHGTADPNPGSNVSVQRRGGAGGDHHQRGIRRGDGVVTRRRARLMIEDGRPSATKPMHVVEVSEESDDDPMMTNPTLAMDQPVPVGGGRDNPPSGMTLSDYCSPSPTPSQGILDLGDDNATTYPFSVLDLSDSHGAAYDTMDYPTIESDIETPRSVNTPLPTSPESELKKETVTHPHLRTAFNSERALTRTPPIFHAPQSQQGNSAHGTSASAGSADNSTFSFDPRNLMINLTPAQIQQLLTTLATQTPSGFESGFLTSADSDENARRQDPSTHHAIQPPNPSLPFDISSYLVPSPQLANLSLGANATPPVTSPTLSSTSAPHDGGPYVPVPDGLIAFDGTDISKSHSNARSSASGTTGTGMAGSADANAAAGAAYAGDLSVMRSPSPFVLPWTYQGVYNGPHHAHSGPATTTTTGGGGYANGNGNAAAAQGFGAGFGFPSFGVGADWSGPGPGTAGGTEAAVAAAAGGGGGGGGGGDFSGLFSPVLQTATAGGVAATATTMTGATGAGPTPNRNLSANGGNNMDAYDHPGSSPGSTNVDDVNLATLSSNWRAAEDIDRDVGALDTPIDNLIHTLGLDPRLMDSGVLTGEGAGSAGATGNGNGNGDGAGPETGRGRKNSVFDFEHFLSTWGLPSDGGASGGGGAGAGGGVGVGVGGIASAPPSDAATTASGSTPSGGSVAGEGPDGFDVDGVDGVENGEVGFTPRKPVVARAPLQNQNQAPTAPAMLVDEGARPINKKARTSLTASAPTSTGVPATTTTTVEAGGRKRRSAMVGTGVDEGEGADASLETGSQVRTRSVSRGAGAKAKKRRG